MVVEYDAVTRRLLCNAIELESTLLLAGSCSTVADSLVWLELNQCDLLLTDLGFPDGSGLIVIVACRRLNPQADIIVITMSFFILD
jgi:DNA-binding NarL/FixJ family response regulator